jgi:GNAT superfamily N-acetyltransferase
VSASDEEGPTPGLVFEPISQAHHTASFRCGTAFLDWFLDREALTLAAADVSRTVVLVKDNPDVTGTEKPVEGYFTLEAGVMPTAFLSLLPDDTLARLIQPDDAMHPGISPLAELPVVYLAYLARDLRNRGRGYGDLLLIEALRQAEAASRRIGAAGVFLVATEEGARFYEEYGFRPFGDFPRKMFLSMAAVREVLALVVDPSS